MPRYDELVDGRDPDMLVLDDVLVAACRSEDFGMDREWTCPTRSW